MSNDIQLIEIPKWGLSMEEGTVNEWLVSEGDSFKTGDELVEIESSKIANVLEAHFDGTLRRILAASGEALPIGTPIGVAADASVSDEDIDAFVAALGSAPAGSAPAAAAPAADPPPAEVAATVEQPKTAAPTTSAAANGGTSVPESLKGGEDDSALPATLHARRLAEELGLNLHNVTASGRNNRISRQDVESAIVAAGGSVAARQSSKADKASSSTKDDSQVAATPVARRLAKQLGVNLHDCRASGSHGRVCKADVEAAHSLLTDTDKPAAQLETPTGNESTEIPMDGMRRTIAARLQKSKQTAPHFRLTVDVEIDHLLSVRKILNTSSPDAKVSVNDFLIKACASALTKLPDCNVQFDGHSITRFKDADISVAVALDGGLITPIVKAANNKGLVAISNEVRSLVTKAKAGTLTLEEFQGGTFTISNLGMFGIKQFDAIINPPQCAILAVGSGEQRIVVKEGEPAVATILTLTLCSDHRVIDGALGAQFLQKLKWLVENPAMMVA